MSVHVRADLMDQVLTLLSKVGKSDSGPESECSELLKGHAMQARDLLHALSQERQKTEGVFAMGEESGLALAVSASPVVSNTPPLTLSSQSSAKSPPSTTEGASCDVGLMFSDPLVQIDPVKKLLYPIDKLNQTEEKKLIHASIGEAKKALSTRTFPATINMLRILLSNGCGVLHFSGHGSFNHRGVDVLAFENQDGSAHLLSAMDLKELFSAGASQPRLVFLASCHSLEIGKALISAGVEYVVCVRRREKIMDKASLTFARLFYHALSRGLHGVRACFEIGKYALKNTANIPEAECEKFVLLSSQPDQTSEYECPDEPLFPDAIMEDGAVCDTTTPKLPHFPHTSSLFCGRHVEMHHLLVLLTNSKQRVITVRGPPGIGKSSLCRAVGNYVADRFIFTDGVVYICFRGCHSYNSFLRQLRHGLTSVLTAAEGDETKGADTVSDEEQESCITELLHAKEILLVLDNFEDPINADSVDLQAFLGTLLVQASSTKLLLGTRCAIGGGMQEQNEKVYDLKKLQDLAAAKLFQAYCPRDIARSEVTTTAPAKHGRMPSYHEVLLSLSKHPVLQFLQGHPQAIALVAPLMQDSNLDELGRLLRTKSLAQLEIWGCRVDEKQALGALVASLQLSVEALRRSKPYALRALCLMALLPGGATDDDFAQILGGDWEEQRSVLTRSSIIVRKNQSRGMRQIYSTFPFITKYAEGFLFESHRSSLRQTCIFADKVFLSHLLDRFRKRYASLSGELFDHLCNGHLVRADDLIEQHELNFVSALRSWRAEVQHTHTSAINVSLESSMTAGQVDAIVSANVSSPFNTPEKLQKKKSVFSPSSPLKLQRQSSTERKANQAALFASPIAKPESNVQFQSRIPRLIKTSVTLGSLDLRPPKTNTNKSTNSSLKTAMAVKEISTLPMSNEAWLAVTYSSSLLILGRYEESVAVVNRGIALLETMHANQRKIDVLGQANLLRVRGVLSSRKPKESESAKKDLGTAAVLFRESGCLLGASVTACSLGSVHLKNGNLKGARRFYERAEQGFMKLDHEKGLLHAYLRLVHVNRKLLDEDKSRAYLDSYRWLKTQVNKQTRKQQSGRDKNHRVEKNVPASVWVAEDMNIHLCCSRVPQSADPFKKTSVLLKPAWRTDKKVMNLAMNQLGGQQEYKHRMRKRTRVKKSTISLSDARSGILQNSRERQRLYDSMRRKEAENLLKGKTSQAEVKATDPSIKNLDAAFLEDSEADGKVEDEEHIVIEPDIELEEVDDEELNGFRSEPPRMAMKPRAKRMIYDSSSESARPSKQRQVVEESSSEYTEDEVNGRLKPTMPILSDVGEIMELEEMSVSS